MSTRDLMMMVKGLSLHRKTPQPRGTLSDLLPAALRGEPAAIEGMRDGLGSDSSWKTLHAVVDERLRSEAGRSPLAMHRLCRAIGLTERLRSQLRESDDPAVRAQAARTLRNLRENVELETVLELLDSSNPIAVLAAAETVASFGEPRLLLPVFRALRERTSLTPDEMAVVLLKFGEDICPAAHELLKGVLRQYLDSEGSDVACPIDSDTEIDRTDAAAQIAIVGVLAAHGYGPAVPTFSRLLGACTNEELRRSLTKAIAAAGDVWATTARSRELAA